MCIPVSDLRKGNLVRTEHGILPVHHLVFGDVYVLGKDQRVLYARNVEGFDIDINVICGLFEDVQTDENDGEVRIQNCCFDTFNDGLCYSAGEGMALSEPVNYAHELQNLYYWLNRKELKLKV